MPVFFWLLQIASVRLAYQDLSLQQKKEQQKLQQVDPVKAQQVERLGMGFGSRM
jgi:ADP-ribosylation factor GTPase-activating protein 2/3